MYFQTQFPVPSLKQLSVKFLHHWEGLRSFCSMPDFCHHNYYGHCMRDVDKFWPGSFPLWQNSEFCLLLALTSPNIEKAYDAGIIWIYRSSVTYWCKVGVHTLRCSHARAVSLPQQKQLHLKKSCFPTLKQENSSISGTTQRMNTKLAPMWYRDL